MLSISDKFAATNYPFLEHFEKWLLNFGLNASMAQLVKVVISLLVIALIALVTDYLAKRIFLSTMQQVAKRTKTDWDDILIRKKFFNYLAHFIPAITVYLTIGIALYDYTPRITLLVQLVVKVYMVILGVFAVSAFIDSTNEIYQRFPFAKSRPIKGYLQVVKIIIYVFAAIGIVGIILNRDPSNILFGLGASTAVLMLVFKDPIMGLVASIQLSANKMLKIGDWIEMPSQNVDGDVIDISLTTVKVKNFDNTVSTIPPHSLVTGSFKNWRGMIESSGRRIKKSFLIDYRSIDFCSDSLLQKFSTNPLLRQTVEYHLKNAKEKNGHTAAIPQKPTNLGLYRAYVKNFLGNHPDVNTDLTLLVRLLQPKEEGIPLEFYFFLKEKRWVEYEAIQSELLEQLIALLPLFELKLYRPLSGNDISLLLNREGNQPAQG